MNNPFYLYLLIAIIGSVFGSFATVLVSRIPKNESIVTPRSRCHFCDKKLSHRQLIPIFSYLVANGKTQCCNSKIPLMYPLVELWTSLLFVLSWHKTGPSIFILSLITLAVLSSPLFIIDLKLKRLPNSLTATGLILGVIYSFMYFLILDDISIVLKTILFSGVSFSFFLILGVFSKGGMGMGDVKLAGMLGALLAPFGGGVIFLSFMIAFFLGAIFGIALLATKKASRKSLIPFGPYMLIGAWIAVLLNDELVARIIQLWIIN